MAPDIASRSTGRIRALAIYFAAGLGVIAAGLTLRFVPAGLPAGLVKYGGSALWGAMVYCLVAALLPGRRGRTVLLVAAAIALLVELSRLIHTPWLDAFRLTLPGALLLGRIFSPWNLVAYATGLAASALVDWWGGPRADERSRSAPVGGGRDACRGQDEFVRPLASVQRTFRG